MKKYLERSLIGLSTGDSFGDSFFGNEDEIKQRIESRVVNDKWLFTDDTVMGISIYNILLKYGEINQSELAKEFSSNYYLDIDRGYGGTAHRILREISNGDWSYSKSVFDGMGSMGNGAAMRAGIIGAYFHDENVDKVIEQAKLSAEITHFNNEGVAGAIAVALASYIYCNDRGISSKEFFDFILEHLPVSEVRKGIRIASNLLNFSVQSVVGILGNGMKLTAQDTVPYTIWCIANNLKSYEEALWTTVSGLGDRDTTCAIVGSVVGIHSDIPSDWMGRAENPNNSIFIKK